MIAKRTQRIVARLTKSEKVFVMQGAKASRKNVTEFVRDAVFRAAAEAIAIENGRVKQTPQEQSEERKRLAAERQLGEISA